MAADVTGSLSPQQRLAFPLDVASLAEARRWVEQLGSVVGVFKVGLELFTAVGPDAIAMVHDAGAACFLDLKLHDIPKTMARATAAAQAHGVRYLTVHASAGSAGLSAAQKEAGDTQLLAVTALTSLGRNDLQEIGWDEPPHQVVYRLANVAHKTGITGFVCSSLECATLRQQVGQDACLVVPGIRPEGSAIDDQHRVATPGQAIQAGASLLVVGRPISQATDPVAAATKIAEAIAEA